MMLLLIAGIKQLGNLSQTCFEESSFTVTNGKSCVVTSDKIYATSYSQITWFWLPQLRGEFHMRVLNTPSAGFSLRVGKKKGIQPFPTSLRLEFT